MDDRVLKYFLGVAREGNITRAAELLHVTQPTLSRQLAKLEEDLGVCLFNRSKNGIMLTDEGMILKRRAEEIVELAEKTKRELTEHEEMIEGEIEIGSGELESAKILPKLFKSFKGKYPNVRFDVYTGNADQIKDRLDNGLADFGILLEPVSIEKYDFIRFDIPEHWVVLMRSDSPLAKKKSITTKDLAGKPLIFVKRPSIRNELESWFHGQLDELNVIATSNMSTNASILVEQNFGYAIIVEGSMPFMDETKICTRPLSPERTTTSVIAWKKNQSFAAVTKRFLEHIRDNLGNDIYTD